MMMQTILVGLDWGETVDAVANLAAELAVVLNASLKAVYVEDVRLIEATERAAVTPLPSAGSIPYRVPNLRDLEEKFRAEERVLGKRFLRLVADTRIRGSFLVDRGEVAPILVRESRAHDLLVMGKYSEPAQEGEARRPLGDHVEEVLRHTWCPVALVPPWAAELGERFLAVYDGSEGAHRALSSAVRLARVTKARLSVISVGAPSLTDELLSEANGYLEAHRIDGHLVAREGDPAEEVLREARESGADLVALGAYGAHHRRGTFHPEVSQHVVRALDTTALVCGSREEK